MKSGFGEDVLVLALPLMDSWVRLVFMDESLPFGFADRGIFGTTLNRSVSGWSDDEIMWKMRATYRDSNSNILLMLCVLVVFEGQFVDGSEDSDYWK